MPGWRSVRFWVAPICVTIYTLILFLVLPYVIYSSVKDGFTRKDQLILIGGLFLVVTVPISVWTIAQHLFHFNRPNLQKPIIRIMWMVPIYSFNAWLSLIFPKVTIYMDSIRECYEAYVIYNFMVFLLSALSMEMDLTAVMREKPQVRHIFPLWWMRPWNMGSEFIYKCKHGILQYALVQPIVTIISLICYWNGVYGKGTLSLKVAYPYLVVMTNISQFVAMYCLVLFYKANKDCLTSMRPLAKFLCIKAIIFFSYFQGLAINLLVYLGVIKNIFGTTETDDYQILSEKLQNFLLCLEMFLAALAHHYSYPYHEHQINIPNYRPRFSMWDSFRNMLDTADVRQDFTEHLGAVRNSILRPFRPADPFDETKALFCDQVSRTSVVAKSELAGSSRSHTAAQQYGAVAFAGHHHKTIPIDQSTTAHLRAVPRGRGARVEGTGSGGIHQGAPPQQETVFRDGSSRSSPLTTTINTATTTRTSTETNDTLRKSDSDNTASWLSNSFEDDNFIMVRGVEEDLIKLNSDAPKK